MAGFLWFLGGCLLTGPPYFLIDSPVHRLSASVGTRHTTGGEATSKARSTETRGKKIKRARRKHEV